MDRQNSLFKDAVFVIICFLIAFTPMARGSVNLWAETLIQIFAVIGIAVLLIEKILLKPEHSKLAKIKEKSFKLNFKPDLYIITLTVIIGIASLFFQIIKLLRQKVYLSLLTYINILYGIRVCEYEKKRADYSVCYYFHCYCYLYYRTVKAF